MKTGRIFVLFVLFALLAFAGLMAAAGTPQTYLIYTGGLVGQLAPCG